jgi:hypothetical protein
MELLIWLKQVLTDTKRMEHVEQAAKAAPRLNRVAVLEDLLSGLECHNMPMAFFI